VSGREFGTADIVWVPGKSVSVSRLLFVVLHVVLFQYEKGNKKRMPSFGSHNRKITQGRRGCRGQMG